MLQGKLATKSARTQLNSQLNVGWQRATQEMKLIGSGQL